MSKVEGQMSKDFMTCDFMTLDQKNGKTSFRMFFLRKEKTGNQLIDSWNKCARLRPMY